MRCVDENQRNHSGPSALATAHGLPSLTVAAPAAPEMGQPPKRSALPEAGAREAAARALLLWNELSTLVERQAGC